MTENSALPHLLASEEEHLEGDEILKTSTRQVEKIRKASARICLVDAHRKPLPGLDIEISQNEQNHRVFTL